MFAPFTFSIPDEKKYVSLDKHPYIYRIGQMMHKQVSIEPVSYKGNMNWNSSEVFIETEMGRGMCT